MSTTPDSSTPSQTTENEMNMEELLNSEASKSSQLRRGEIIEGVVLGKSSDGLIVDVGTKMEAVVPQGEMLSLGVGEENTLKSGDKITVMVLQPFSSEGHGIVSLDRARGEEGWQSLAQRLESGESFMAQVVGHNKGGLLANVEGVNAFIPLSQVESVRRDAEDSAAQLADFVGKELRTKVIEINRRKNRAILSERAAMSEWRQEQKDRILSVLEEGQVRDGTVSSIADFGVFVDIGGADGLAHVTELSWERNKKPKELFKVGDSVKAFILKIEPETKKISLSLKRASTGAWDEVVERMVIGQILIGRVTKLMKFGAFIHLEGPVEGLVHISEVTNRRIQHPQDVLKENDVVPVKLVRIDKERHRLGLSVRQARNDAEAMGFGFDRNGAVIDWPDDVRAEFDLPKRDASKISGELQTATESAIQEAVSRDPEPVSAFAQAFADALEQADGDDDDPGEGNDESLDTSVLQEELVGESNDSIEGEVSVEVSDTESEVIQEEVVEEKVVPVDQEADKGEDSDAGA